MKEETVKIDGQDVPLSRRVFVPKIQMVGDQKMMRTSDGVRYTIDAKGTIRRVRSKK